MLLDEVVQTSALVAGSAGRRVKIEALAECLRHAAGAGADDVPAVVAFLSGELVQRQIGVGWAALRDLPPPVASSPSLTVANVHAVFGRIGADAGSGSARRRRGLLADLFAAATTDEQHFLRRLLTGELRQGAQEGVMVEAVARAAGLPAADVRRALMLRGDLGPVATEALLHGSAGLAAFRLELGRGLKPMLAQSADGVEAAFDRLAATAATAAADSTGADGEAGAAAAAVEWKLDGVRVQVHRAGGDVRVFTRSLDDVTARVPEVVEAALTLPGSAAVLDGEAIALRPDGRPHPFQITGSRVGSRTDVARLREAVPLTLFFFDVLHADGEDLLDAPGARRHEALSALVPERLQVPRLVADEPGPAAAFLADAVGRGHEGVVVKSLTAGYEAGRRGAGWIKVKPRHTLDLVVLAAEWGHGRRQGWLSNLHLGARDDTAAGGESGAFVMLGKTFKGLTDEMLAWQTGRLQELAIPAESDDWVVRVRPELVVEIAFDGVQTSPRYPAGMALRFARVLRYRPDKPAAEADTVAAVRALHLG